MSSTENGETGNLATRTRPSDSSQLARWYLIHTKPREDGRALEHLQRQGFHCYRPVRQLERLRHGARTLVAESLFPRYLFILLDSIQDNWYPIRSTRGVHSLVSFNQRPVAVPDAIIEGIRTRLGEVQPEPLLKAGEHVVITEPPFSQFEAIFIAPDGDQRVVLLLNILQRDQELSFPLSSIAKSG